MPSLQNLLGNLYPIVIALVLIGGLIWAAVRPKALGPPKLDLVYWLGAIAAGIAAGLFLLLLIGTVSVCALRDWCPGTDGDAWAPAFFAFPLGVLGGGHLIGLLIAARRKARHAGG